jgi:DNA-binding YbaB/EbfC family protein
MSQFDMGGLGGLFAGLQQKVEDMKRWSSETTVTGEAGGGLVKVTVTCDYQVTSVEIGEEGMQDRELLEDLIRAATGEALRLVKEALADRVQELTGGLPIPPGLF